MSKAKHTPGPWQWETRTDGETCLIHPHNGWLIVMDFIRFGMRKAQPRFATWNGEERGRMGGIMRPAKELVVADHPDARLIAAAPDLLAALKELAEYVYGFADHGGSVTAAHHYENARTVIARAESDYAYTTIKGDSK